VTSLGRPTTLVLDFDGTITEVDLLDRMARTFGDPAVYQEVEEGIHAGTLSLQECITREFEPVTVSLEEMTNWVLANVRIRPGLPELVGYVRSLGWGVRVLSSGFVELIEPVLTQAGVGDVELVGNSVDARPDGWRVRWRDETLCTVCGEACKRSGLPPGDVIYVGDGISDRCAALASQRIFATRGLARWLAVEGVAFEPFDDFEDVAAVLTA
jgi:2,3-diketo-5-methylthio-1-phosphopentane phosphatase